MKKISVLFLVFYFSSIDAQHMDIEAMMKDTKLKINGGINANAMFYHSNMEQSRDPFTYMLTGSLNFKFMTFNMPLSYTLTNNGNQFSYQSPINFNRFSLTPKYKWMKAYIGDNSMFFSNYTMNSHPFRGLGVELTPRGPLKFSAMGGRLLKAVEGDTKVGLSAVYQRLGYGSKIDFEKEKYKLEIIGFYAVDKAGSIHNPTDVVPLSNLAGSVKVSTTLIKNVNIEAEYALSLMKSHLFTADSLAGKYTAPKSISKAFNARVNYKIGKANLGITYENVDPTYRTLGSLYFNNDLENVGFTFASPFFKDKLTITSQIGYQRDNLNRAKDQTSVRLVGNINSSLKVSDRLNIAGSYSNFTSTTNRRLDQFAYINSPELVPADTLNYQQLSQTGNVNVNYLMGKNKNHVLNFNYNIAGQANKQGGLIRRGQASTVQNYNLTHSVNFPSNKIGLNTSINYTTNTVGILDNKTYGGSVSVSKKFLENKLNSNIGILYNKTQGSHQSGAGVAGIKLNANYTLFEKHNFSLYGIQMFRKIENRSVSNDLTINFNYGYTF